MTIRHEFYETDEKITISVFDRGADPADVKVEFHDRKCSYTNGEKQLVLEPLKGQIDPSKSEYSVGKVKVEIRLAKMSAARWGALVGDSPDPLQPGPSTFVPTPTMTAVKPKKNWATISDVILEAEPEKTTDQDPNVGGDGTVNSFFQKIFGDADEDTKRAMMKSYSESGGTTLSTNWDEVKKAKVEVKPPAGSEWKKWN